MSVPLEGSNLIEASAGTGKTFSIAILVLRLLLRSCAQTEKSRDGAIYINQILMVTFTTAAVAELESRIRKYLYVAEKYATGAIDEQDNIRAEHPMIAQIVEEAKRNAPASDHVRQHLKDNLLLLDESNIMTIHSFCQSTLNEFAIETNQLFGVELFTETDRLIDIELNRFWRKYITTLDTTIIRQLDLLQKKKI
ncbi:UvrD-helicase domain-containing protein [Paracnuella aquatica]